MNPFVQNGEQTTQTEVCGRRFNLWIHIIGDQGITSLHSAAAGSESVSSPSGLLLFNFACHFWFSRRVFRGCQCA